jgi:hypothetical protein
MESTVTRKLQWAEDYGCERLYVPGVGWLTVQLSIIKRGVVVVSVFGERLKREFTDIEEGKRAALRVALARIEKALPLLKEIVPPLVAQPVKSLFVNCLTCLRGGVERPASKRMVTQDKAVPLCDECSAEAAKKGAKEWEGK